MRTRRREGKKREKRKKRNTINYHPQIIVEIYYYLHLRIQGKSILSQRTVQKGKDQYLLHLFSVKSSSTLCEKTAQTTSNIVIPFIQFQTRDNWSTYQVPCLATSLDTEQRSVVGPGACEA